MAKQPAPKAPAKLPISVNVPANQPSVPIPGPPVKAGEIWRFHAQGRWRDWFIPCGPEGYQLFLADILDIRPRAPDEPFLCLMGMLQGQPSTTFRIGRDREHTFTANGTLEVFANDVSTRYGNNSGSITLHAARGQTIVGQGGHSSGRYDGLLGAWRLLMEAADRTFAIGLVALLSLGVCLVLAFMDQGQDLIRTVGEEPVLSWRQAALLISLVFLAVQTWIWPRMVINANCGRNRGQWGRLRGFLTWLPRLLGLAPFVLTGTALLLTPSEHSPLIIVLMGLAALFVAGVVYRQDLVARVTRRFKNATPPARLGRWWVIFGLGLGAVAMVVVTLWPVEPAYALGAPAVVLLAVGLIIPPMVIVMQQAREFRLPLVALLVVATAVFSQWNDNHSVGRRAFGGEVRAAPAERTTLAKAYAAWSLQAPLDANGRKVMLLVASEGGASRAGHWTGETLSALHKLTGGRVARSLFAISSVSGGSVGAVGYAATLRDRPTLAPAAMPDTLAAFTGDDVLSSVMGGMLFPDLLQRFLPVAVLPDRAEALERGWEASWARNCRRDGGGCDPKRIEQPYLSLWSNASNWLPAVIVNGANEETGRRILTSPIAFTQREIDADDFYAETGRDVAASTAIHNGARFSWVSPAGTLTGLHGKRGHVVDGGYFDGGGVETIRELARAIVQGPGQADQLDIIVVFIGYKGTIDDSLPTSVHRPVPTRRLTNEVAAPLVAVFQSRTAHGEHLAQELKVASAPDATDLNPFNPADGKLFGAPNVVASYRPVLLCDEGLRPPMDWALSTKAKQLMRQEASQTGDRCGAARAIGAIAAVVNATHLPASVPPPLLR